ncbi:hypothetical protein A374_18806 [Fictibacillus macauensis ZFHKF-1]|uniref:Lipoprotein n=1 Tax=Fictibacillus macauensis ZFHKF-1 TaxID=1196324 RepID=I8AEK7_9BACL|nr:hypothetical protein [Fictibacillus macauensis]EIT83769.1 hypothetical protein A374_18806 [Fictibacillus macauensis ZFHKF-1]
MLKKALLVGLMAVGLMLGSTQGSALAKNSGKVTTAQAGQLSDRLLQRINTTFANDLKKHHISAFPYSHYKKIQPTLRQYVTKHALKTTIDELAKSYSTFYCNYQCMPDTAKKSLRLTIVKQTASTLTLSYYEPDTGKSPGSFYDTISLKKEKGTWKIDSYYNRYPAGFNNHLKLSKKEVVAHLKASGIKASYVKTKVLYTDSYSGKVKIHRKIYIFKAHDKRFGVFADVGNYEYNRKLLK